MKPIGFRVWRRSKGNLDERDVEEKETKASSSSVIPFGNP